MEGSTPESLSLLKTIALFIQQGGVFMWVILLVWAVGGAIGLERMSKLRTFDVDGPSLMNELQRYILSHDI